MLGAYYLIQTKSAFRPYLGLALGVFLQRYAVKWDESFTNTGFGIVPEIGFYYLLGSLVLQASAGFNLVLSDAPAAEYDSTTEDTGKANSFSVNVGLSFPIGGK